MRLIDADSLIEDLRGSLFYSDAIPFVEAAPTVEAIGKIVPEVVIKPVEKQSPKKLIINPGGRVLHVCSACRMPLMEGMRYCYKCGQKIDWSVEE